MKIMTIVIMKARLQQPSACCCFFCSSSCTSRLPRNMYFNPLIRPLMHMIASQKKTAPLPLCILADKAHIRKRMPDADAMRYPIPFVKPFARSVRGSSGGVGGRGGGVFMLCFVLYVGASRCLHGVITAPWYPRLPSWCRRRRRCRGRSRRGGWHRADRGGR